jgi:hypothetical protein
MKTKNGFDNTREEDEVTQRDVLGMVMFGSK